MFDFDLFTTNFIGCDKPCCRSELKTSKGNSITYNSAPEKVGIVLNGDGYYYRPLRHTSISFMGSLQIFNISPGHLPITHPAPTIGIIIIQFSHN